MIARTPDLSAARTAAAMHLDASALAEDTPQASAAASSSATPSSPSSIGVSRDQLIALAATLVLNLSTNAANRWGAHWIYSESECMAVATASVDVAELYIGKLDGPWTNLCVVLGATIGVRVLGPKLPPPSSASEATAESAAA